MRFLGLLALLTPLPLIAALSAHVADVAGKALGAELGGVVTAALAAPQNEPPLYVAVPEVAADTTWNANVAPTKRAGKRGRASAAQASSARALFVSAPVVLRLANREARPTGVPVGASSAHPAGLRLSGVTGLGIGLKDGDVLTRAAGAAALDVAGVVGAVLSARGRGAGRIAGRFWRDSQEWVLVVEQPYPEAREPNRAASRKKAAGKMPKSSDLEERGS